MGRRDLSIALGFSPADRESVEESLQKILAYVPPLLPIATLPQRHPECNEP
jgi:hypothetical protein